MGTASFRVVLHENSSHPYAHALYSLMGDGSIPALKEKAQSQALQASLRKKINLIAWDGALAEGEASGSGARPCDTKIGRSWSARAAPVGGANGGLDVQGIRSRRPSNLSSSSPPSSTLPTTTSPTSPPSPTSHFST